MSKEKESKATVRYLFGLAETQNARLYGSVIFGVLSGIAMFIPFYAVYRVMLVLFDEADSNIIFWGAIAAVCIVLRFLFHGISGMLSHVCAYNVLYEVRKKICEHLGKVNLGYFGENSSGEVKKVLMEDVERLEHFLAHQIPDITTAIAVPVIVLIFLMTVNVPMALILLVPIIISFIVQGIMLAVYKPMVEEGTVLLGQMNSAVVQFVTGMPVMKAYNLNAETYSTYADTSKNYNFLWKKVSKSAAPLSAVCTVLTESGVAISVPFGGCLMLKGSLTATEYVFFIIMSIVFLAAFNNLMSFAQIFSQISAGIERIKLVMEVPELTTDTQNIHAPSESFIEFKNVSFAYKEKNVLDNINLSLGKGTITAFVGASGAGKSTAAQLMPRFWDVTEGEILIDGRNIKSYSSAELMSMLSFVFQESFLMDATIYENIAMGDPDASKEAVILAAKSAQIHDCIMDLPEGYDTKYGTAGVKLSGGERQRICIARAILKNAPILIFDEATSFTDMENEHKIQLALDELLKGKTVIMIAHRLHTIIDADRICVFEEGHIKESGGHSELLSVNGAYAKMWQGYVGGEA